MTTREQIYTALYTLVSGAANFTTSSRKFQIFTKLNASDMPYLCMAQAHEAYRNNGTGMPPVKEFNCEVYIYAVVDPTATGAAPSSNINTLLDGVEAALAPGANGRQTLGGLVWNVFINNTIAIEDGSIAEIAIAVIPITIRVTQ